MRSAGKRNNPWNAYFNSLRSQGFFAWALLAVSILTALVLGTTTYFALLGRQHMRSVLIQNATSSISATCYASRELIDVNLLVAMRSEADESEYENLYSQVKTNIESLRYSVGAERIYVVQRIGGEYLLVLDTGHGALEPFQPFELSAIQQQAYSGTHSVKVNDPGGSDSAINSGALPFYYHGEVIAIVCVDFNSTYINEAYNTTSLIVYLLIGILALMMTALFVASIILFRQNQRNQQQLFDMANKDIVTGLPNRRFIFSYLLERVEHAPPALAEKPLVAFFLDLDDFKSVNDTAGHEVGDHLLNVIATFLSDALNDLAEKTRRECLTARIGGDEFVQLLSEANLEEAEAYAIALIKSFEEDPVIKEFIRDHKIGISIGIAAYPEHTTDSNDLVKFADIAMYYSKSQGKHTYTIYDPSMGHYIEGISLDVRESSKSRRPAQTAR